MTFSEFYQAFERNKFYIFSFEDVLSVFPNEQNNSIKKALYRWKKKGRIQSLKKGLYELSYPKDFFVPDLYVANKLYYPSYISLETALSNYSIIPEVAMAVTSITTKPTRSFKNKHGLFTFRTIKTDAFCGYYVEKHRNLEILIAEPEKALIDYIYFKVYNNKYFDFRDERFDKNIIAGLKKRKLNKYAKQFNLNPKEFHAIF
ncbi:MAG: hypothetical protein KAR05_11780 [Candidatus Omnitrophica bacterium]|nr:hypothetical protein [Candidatus Omnitrophota bacterium]